MKKLILTLSILSSFNIHAQNLWDGSTTVATTSANGNVLLNNGNISLGTSNTGWPLFINNTTRAGGIYNFSNYAANSTQYGIYNYLTTSSTTGNKYGIYNYLSISSPNISYGIYSNFGATGDNDRYGIYSNLSASGTGKKYGIYSNVTSSGTGERYSVYSSCSGAGSYGVFSIASGTGSKAGFFSGELETRGKMILTGNNQSRFVFITSTSGATVGEQSLSIQPNTTSGQDDWNANNALTFYNNGLLQKSTGAAVTKVFSIYRPDLTKDVFRINSEGKVWATEINVMLHTSFPDYVFKSDYNLMSLNEVRNYIQANGHLPNIPTAQEVEADGVNLGEMTKTLVEKVEELTLYLLQQQTELELQKIKSAEQQAEIDALKQQVNAPQH